MDDNGNANATKWLEEQLDQLERYFKKRSFPKSLSALHKVRATHLSEKEEKGPKPN